MIPIFPLNSVLCPGGRIPLQLFEPRYIDMVSQCLKDQGSFVITLLTQGSEVETFAKYFDIGTTVFIQDFNRLPNGLLGITVEGVEKVRVTCKSTTTSGLHMGEVEPLQNEPFMPMPDVFSDLVGLLKRLMQYPAVQNLNMEVDWEDARHIGWRLTELLPITGNDKQMLLELDNPVSRLQKICEVLTLLEE